jgi:hypothetical protein
VPEPPLPSEPPPSAPSPPATRRPGPATLPVERDLARVWVAQRFEDGPLATVDGLPVAVLYPGRSGGRSGPDFRDAVVALGDAPPRVGDVELHRDATDFVRHGHADDPAYDGVMLHVVFRPNDEPRTQLASGRSAPVLAVAAPAGPGWPAPRREPCALAQERSGTDAIRAVLRNAGLWRMRRKLDERRSEIERDGPAQALYRALAAALGQTANATAFRALTDRLPIAELAEALNLPDEAQRTAVLERRLLHAAGLDGALLAPAPTLPWVIRGQRPAASPARRIRALDQLLSRLSVPDLATATRALVRRSQEQGARDLLDLLTVRAPTGPALCGRGRAVEVAVNALLPWAAACHALAGDEHDADATLLLAGALPAAESYGVVAHLRHNLQDARGRPLITSALAQQGALALLTEWCRRGGCGRCPLS